jgi:hypothetical protein
MACEEEEEDLCLLCLEPLDDTDRLVLSYCGGPCKFRPCLFCYTTLYERFERCPNCRQPYDREKVLVEQPPAASDRYVALEDCSGNEEAARRKAADG